MTEKEFEHLKVGDKVWSVTNIWIEGKALYEMRVVGKRSDLGYIETSWLDGSHKTNFFRLDCHTSKAKALEAVIACCEAHIKDKENDIAYEKKEVDRYKAELAKAKEEEEVCWITDSGEVRKVRKPDYPCYIHYATEREAYEALAEYYKGKYEEALVKSGKARFVIRCGDKICLVQDVEKAEGNMVWVSDCDGFSLYVPKENVFSTRQEAEAELERRRRNDNQRRKNV